jgi:hypothetical protein
MHPVYIPRCWRKSGSIRKGIEKTFRDKDGGYHYGKHEGEKQAVDDHLLH